MKHAIEQKRGISLIAVLMFMLAASTASIVLFRWIGSENFMSGSRLKQTEAYQAAESGVDAVHAWLSNKGADVGALVGNYFYNYAQNGTATAKSTLTQMHLTKEGNDGNNILGSVSADGSKQKFRVYLTGIDAKNTNSIKFKFLSVGEGRDGSTVTLAAIFDVAGLYQMVIPGDIKQEFVPLSDFDYAYYGGSIKFSGEKTFSSAVVNGNWSGNPPNVSRDFIVTGDFQTSGFGVKVGDTLCVGGVFNPDNDKNSVGAAYIGSAPKFGGNFGNVYCEGNMHVNFPNAKMKNLSINGKLSLENNSSKLVAWGNLVIGENNSTAYIDGSKAENNNANQPHIVICGSVWTRNPNGVQISDNASQRGRNIRFGSILENHTDCINNPPIPGTSPIPNTPPPFLSFTGATSNSVSGQANYKAGTSGYFNLASGSIVEADRSKPTDAAAVKDYCGTKWTSSPPGLCNNGYSAQYVVNDPIASTLGDIKEFLKQKAGGANQFDASEVINIGGRSLRCVSDIVLNIENQGRVLDQNSGPTVVSALNQCYARLKNTPGKLYGGKYLVMKLHQEQDYNLNNTIESALDGNFILIYPNELSRLMVAPTTKNSGVMLFLEKGVNKGTTSAEMKSTGQCVSDNAKCSNSYGGGNVIPANNGIPTDNCPYNYFIYSLGQINTINNWSAKCPLYGSLYFPVSSCAGVTTANNNFGGISNPDLVQELTEAKVLCRRSTGEYKEGDCTEDEKSGSSSGGGKIVESVEDKNDNSYWLPVSSRLKATLMSKKITREKPAIQPDGPSLNGSVLVTPRVIRLTKEAFQDITGSGSSEDKLKNFYSLTFLNGEWPLPRANWPSPTCQPLLATGKAFGLTDNLLPDKTVYRCYFSSANKQYSDFYVAIGGQKGDPVVRLSPPQYTLKPDEQCAVVSLETSKTGEFQNGITVNVGADGFQPVDGWNINDPTALNSNCTFAKQSATAWVVTCNSLFTGRDIAKFNVCYKNPGDISVRLKITVPDNRIRTGQDESIIEGIGAGSKILIQRTDFDPQSYPPSFVRCPHEFLPTSAGWINLQCSKGITKPEIISKAWECYALPGQSATLSPGNIPSACKVSNNYSLQTAQANLNSSITSAINSSSNQVSFPFELEWQSHTINVVGSGTLHYSTNARDILSSSDASGTVSGGSSFKVYREAVYTISLNSGGKLQATCTGNLTCGPSSPMILDVPRNLTGSLIPAGDGTITLAPISAPSVSCNNVSVGKGSTFKFGDIMPISGYECNMSTATYTFNGVTYGSTQNVPSTATDELPLGNHGVSISYNCDGQLHSGVQCNLNLTGMTVQCDKSTYTLGQTAQRPSVTCYANGVSRTARDARFYVEENLISDWNQLLSDDSRPDATLNYTGLITLRSLQCGNDNTLQTLNPPVECGTVVSTTDPPPPPDECSSVAGSPCLEHPSSTPTNPMQKCIKAPDCKCYMCNGIDNNCENDWFWGGTWQNAWPSQGWLKEVSCRDGKTVTIASCQAKVDFGNVVSGTSCYNIRRRSGEVITCSDGSTAGEMTFGYDNTPVPEWSATTGSMQFCTATERTLKLFSVKCGNTAVTEGLPVSCGKFNVGPATCAMTHTNDNACYVTSSGSNKTLNVTYPVPFPTTITCPNNATRGTVLFYITNPAIDAGESEITQWSSNPTTDYNPGNSGNNRVITLRSVECGGVARPGGVCGTINVVTNGNSCGNVTPPATQTITCSTSNSNSGCYESNVSSNDNTGTQVPRPKVYCDGQENTTGAAEFLYLGSGGTNVPASGWNSYGGTIRFNSDGARSVTLKSLYCNTKVEPTSPIPCGNVTIVSPGSCSAPAVTVTSCTPPQSIGNPSGNCYSVPRPTIVCSDGSAAGATVFQIDNSSTLSNWKSSNDPQSFCNPGNNRPIHLTSVDCGSTTVTTGLPYSCGSITIPSTTTPTTISCNTSGFKTCYQTSNDPVPRPNVSCSNNSATGVADFRINGGSSSISNWSNASTTHPITSAGNYAITLHSLVCGGTTITANPAESCGNITVASSCSSTPPVGTTIQAGVNLSVGTHTIANTITCQGACTNGSCTTTGIGGSCGPSPGYHCASLQFTAGSTVTITGGTLRIDNCS
ncbi:MAG: hypothetical protein LBQ87_00900 [Candidatus Fibromonas sp.]|nr:hypothetical protein [Candidatus Fibromonas sp.]